jgi:hypothetical protein
MRCEISIDEVNEKNGQRNRKGFSIFMVHFYCPNEKVYGIEGGYKRTHTLANHYSLLKKTHIAPLKAGFRCRSTHPTLATHPTFAKNWPLIVT